MDKIPYVQSNIPQGLDNIPNVQSNIPQGIEYLPYGKTVNPPEIKNLSKEPEEFFIRNFSSGPRTNGQPTVVFLIRGVGDGVILCRLIISACHKPVSCIHLLCRWSAAMAVEIYNPCRFVKTTTVIRNLYLSSKGD
ncbi:MAG: hypothetical protein MIO93_15750 [ANME-2 cluster archaeon]|nr:hypothetical protein [ANME-2 cluster archaeon]